MPHVRYPCGIRCLGMAETGVWSGMGLLSLLLTVGVGLLALTLFAL